MTRGFKLTPQEAMLRAMTEEQFERKVTDLATLAGWWWYHCRPAWTAKGWRTALSGMMGFPDLVLARTRGRAYDGSWIDEHLFVELKRELSQPTAEQEEWGRRLGSRYRLWRPSDWPVIETELIGRAKTNHS